MGTYRDKLLSYCITYIRALNSGLAGECLRAQMHSKIESMLPLSDDELKDILYNLDAYIGYDIHNPYKNNSIVLGNRLYTVLIQKARERILLDFDRETEEFLVQQGLSVREWIDMWEEDPDFEGGVAKVHYM